MSVAETLGRYQILHEIGRGAMGIVYLGHDPFHERRVAIKVALPTGFRDEAHAELYRSLFYNEMRTAGLLHHPNIVRVYDAGIDEGTYYYVMEYVPGGRTLDEYCGGRSRLPLARVSALFYQCAEALDYAHRKGVIHRDIKPRNILLSDGDLVKLSDFGAALVTDPRLADTQLLEPLGSPLYMAPEQLREEGLTHRCDIYALGVVLYELLVGRHPFAADSLAGLSHRVLNEQAVPVSQLRPELPTALDSVLARSLAKQAEERYASALELAAALGQAIGEPREPLDGLLTESRVKTLGELRFFAGFGEPQLWELLRWAHWEEHASGATIIAEGEEDDSFFIIASGMVAVLKGGREVARLGPGECVGEIGYLAQRRRTATIRAQGPVEVLRVTAERLDRASLDCRVQFQKQFIRTLVERLVHTTERLAGDAVD